MAVRWQDVTIPMRPDMVVWPGDPPFEWIPLQRMEKGDACNTSRIAVCTHTGTHIDAPWHFETEGATLEQVDTSLFFGTALLIDVPAVDEVSAEDLGEGPLPPRVLIQTRNSLHPIERPFRTDYVALGIDAAERLVDEGVRMVGVDYLSVAPYKQTGQETHHRLFQRGIVAVEGLCLGGFATGTYWFTILPLALVGADGAPCRAFIGQEEADA